jgi:energy-coupling factor transporter ATP-binding protein EcfA2
LIDTPVKRYSSGMSARLSFAIAAHLEPDVLLVDEVLSIGDLAFQNQAMRRLKEIVAQAVPVIIVSHQLERVMELCDHALLLAGGRLMKYGSAADTVAAYVDGVPLSGSEQGPPPVAVAGLSLSAACHVRSGERLTVRMRGTVLETGAGAAYAVGVWLRELPGERVLFATHNAACDVALPRSGPFQLAVDLEMNLGAGLYRVQPFVWDLTERTERARGSFELIRVEPSVEAFGPVNLKPRMRLTED